MYWLADIQRARQSGVFNFADVFPILIEDLNPLVLAVGYPQQTFGVDGQPMRDVKLARLGSLAAPALDEVPVLVELQDARIAFPWPGRMSLRDEDVSVGAKGDVVGLIEEARSGSFVPFARLALGPQCEQNFALRAQLHHRVRAHIGSPKVAVLIDAQTVAAHEQVLRRRRE